MRNISLFCFSRHGTFYRITDWYHKKIVSVVVCFQRKYKTHSLKYNSLMHASPKCSKEKREKLDIPKTKVHAK